MVFEALQCNTCVFKARDLILFMPFLQSKLTLSLSATQYSRVQSAQTSGFFYEWNCHRVNGRMEDAEYNEICCWEKVTVRRRRAVNQRTYGDQSREITGRGVKCQDALSCQWVNLRRSLSSTLPCNKTLFPIVKYRVRETKLWKGFCQARQLFSMNLRFCKLN